MRCCRYSKVPKVTITGTSSEIAAAENALDVDVSLARVFDRNGESTILRRIAAAIDRYHLRARILYEGKEVAR